MMLVRLVLTMLLPGWVATIALAQRVPESQDVLPEHASLPCASLALAWDMPTGAASVTEARISLAHRGAELGCCELVPRMIHDSLFTNTYDMADATRDALSRMDCRDGNDELALQLRAALACERIDLDADWLAIMAGLVAGPEELTLLRGEWSGARPSECDGDNLFEPLELAVALTFAGDESALDRVIAAQDADSFYGWLAQSEVIARALCRLPESTRKHRLASLVARMDDEDMADELILACVNLGCWLADDLADAALARHEEQEAARVAREEAQVAASLMRSWEQAAETEE